MLTLAHKSFTEKRAAELATHLARAVDFVTAMLWPRRDVRYELTECGRLAIHPGQWTGREISLDDWAHLPTCALCGKHTHLGLPHVGCVARDAVQDGDLTALSRRSYGPVRAWWANSGGEG